MSQMMPQQTSQGHAPPSVRQFSVFLENKVGKLLDLVRLFDEATDVHLCGVSVLESSDHAVVRIISNNGNAAQTLLREHGLTFAALDLLVVELAEDHTLTSMCLCLLGAELNIRFAYPLMFGANGTPTIAVSVDDRRPDSPPQELPPAGGSGSGLSATAGSAGGEDATKSADRMVGAVCFCRRTVGFRRRGDTSAWSCGP